MPQLVINGEATTSSARVPAEVIAALKLQDRRVAVMVNGDVVPRAELSQRELRDGDVIELISVIGGG